VNNIIQQSYDLFLNPETRPTLSGSLIDDNDCMCAQGCILHYSCGVSFDDLRNLDQLEADEKLMQSLGISRFHAVLIRVVNDKQEGCPQDVLVGEQDDKADQRVLGPNAAELFKFGWTIDSMTNDQWAAAGAAARAAAGAAVRAAARAAARTAVRAAARDAARAAVRDAARAAARAVARAAVRAAARAVARAAARAAARDAARAVRTVVRDAGAAGAAALAIVVKDLISDEHFQVLTKGFPL